MPSRDEPQKRTRPKVTVKRSRQRILEDAREACLSASRAVGIALEAPTGTETRADLTQWARDAAVNALRQISADRFWALLAPNEDIDELPELQSVVLSADDDLDSVRDALMDLVGGSLGQVLLEIGYQPPPPHWELVADARRAAADAVTWSSEVDYPLVRRQLHRLLLALTQLRAEESEEGVQEVLGKAKRVLAGGGLLATILLAQLTGVLDEAREHVVYPAITHVFSEIVDRQAPTPKPRLETDEDAALQELHLATEQARLREAAARVQIAEMELVLMRERVESERMDRDGR